MPHSDLLNLAHHAAQELDDANFRREACVVRALMAALRGEAGAEDLPEPIGTVADQAAALLKRR